MSSTLSNEHIAKFWPDADPEDIRAQWDSLSYQLKKEAEERAQRKNVVTWVDTRTLVKLSCELLQELNEYAHRGYEDNHVYGDRNVMVALINLQNKIEAIRVRQR